MKEIRNVIARQGTLGEELCDSMAAPMIALSGRIQLLHENSSVHIPASDSATLDRDR